MKKRKPRVIWIVITGGIYDCVHHVKPGPVYIKGCVYRGCEVVKFIEDVK